MTRIWRPYPEAKAFVHTLRLKSQAAWNTYCKEGNKPSDIPSHPDRVYRDQFLNWGEWLGTGRIAKQDREYLPFAEARAYVQQLGFKTEKEWAEYCRNGNLPPMIPATPRHVYRSEFISIGNWLGTNTISLALREYLPFAEARAYVQQLGLKNNKEWLAFCQSGEKPHTIPATPERVYATEFRGFGDWLGTHNQWNKKALIALLCDLQSHVKDLSERELYLLLQQAGALPALRLALAGTSPLQIIQDIRDPDKTEHLHDALLTLSEEEVPTRKQDDGGNTLLPEERCSALEPEVEEADSFLADEEERQGSIESLQAIDPVVALLGGIETTVAEDLVMYRVRLLWERYSHEGDALIEMLRQASGGAFFTEIQRRFLFEVEEVKKLSIPAGWSFTTDGIHLVPPNTMQCRTAWMIREQLRAGNWSAPGAGKTVSAILASRVCNAKVTLIVTNLATLDGWQRQILQTYPDSRIHTEIHEELFLNHCGHHYLLLNYEKFQGAHRSHLVKRLLSHSLDFIVLDEVHFAKQRDTHISKRRKSLLALLQGAGERNAELRVLAMSATPVINNLAEAKALLELVTGHVSSDLKTRATVNNALAMHRKLMQHGFRYHPHSEQAVQTELLTTVRNDLLPTLQECQQNILAVEQTLLPAKLEVIRPHLQKRMLVYTHYVQDMLLPIQQALLSMGYTSGLYTGEDKSGLGPFLRGEVDILVASRPVLTGLDGLQKVCRHLILLSLPWTGAEYEQLLGRVRRQGSVFAEVKVLVPQVMLAHEQGESWSWDQARWSLIHYKRTLSDCAVDGHIPETIRISEQVLWKKSKQALQKWIATIEQSTEQETIHHCAEWACY